MSLNTKRVLCSVPILVNEPGNAISVSGGRAIAVATSSKVSLYDAQTCTRMASTNKLNNGSVYSVGWIQPLGSDRNNFYFRAKHKKADQWEDLLFTYSMANNSLSAVAADLTLDEGDFFYSGQLRPGTKEAWFFALGRQPSLRVVDVSSGKTLQDRHAAHRSAGASASDLQFSKDGSKLALATGWSVGIIDAVDRSKDKIYFEVGCELVNPNFCSSDDGMAVTFNSQGDKVVYAGDKNIGSIAY